MSKQLKIGLIGAGNIGGTLAHLCLIRQLGNVILYDINESMAKGKALDLQQCCPIENADISIKGTSQWEELQGADVLVVTAGLPRKPGMSRDDLLEINAKIMKSIGEGVRKACPQAFLICVTNPLDAMVEVLQRFSQVPDHSIVGMAGILDSARFRTFLSMELKVSVSSIQAYVLGGHGDTMVPLLGMTQVGGLSLKEWIASGRLSEEKLQAIIERTRQGGAEIVSLLKNGSAFYAPASAALEILESFARDRKKVLPCAAKLTQGEYGIQQPLFIGVPVIIGAKGVEKIVQVPLSPEEQAQLHFSASAVSELKTALKSIQL